MAYGMVEDGGQCATWCDTGTPYSQCLWNQALREVPGRWINQSSIVTCLLAFTKTLVLYQHRIQSFFRVATTNYHNYLCAAFVIETTDFFYDAGGIVRNAINIVIKKGQSKDDDDDDKKCIIYLADTSCMQHDGGPTATAWEPQPRCGNHSHDIWMTRV